MLERLSIRAVETGGIMAGKLTAMLMVFRLVPALRHHRASHAGAMMAVRPAPLPDVSPE
jgi:hypothetical protein